MTQEARLTIDLAALRHNIATVRKAVEPALVMAVVKANAYGHGAVECARAFEDAGVDWLGVVDLDEAIELRRAGISVPVLAWLHAPGETFERAVQFDVTPGISDLAQLEACAAAGVPAVHLCLDTGLSRNGAVESEWEALFDRAAELRDVVTVEGVMSHLSNTSPDEDGHQVAAFVRALGLLGDRGIEPALKHLAASAASLSFREARLDLVRVGLASYGLSPFADRSPADIGIRPALTLAVPVIGLKTVPRGEGTSYGLTWRADVDTRLALLPIGYADGIDRMASNRAQVLIGGRLRRVVGRIAMNAMTVELGPVGGGGAAGGGGAGGAVGAGGAGAWGGVDAGADIVRLGDRAILFGDAAAGHPTVADWAQATDTITYEVVARLSPRLPRRYR